MNDLLEPHPIRGAQRLAIGEVMSSLAGVIARGYLWPHARHFREMALQMLLDPTPALLGRPTHVVSSPILASLRRRKKVGTSKS
jgi:hypothetical protein